MSDNNQNESSLGLAENVGSLLSYIFLPITSVIFFFLEKKNQTIRFHAAQGIIIGVLLIALNIVVMILSVILAVIFLGFIGVILSAVLGLISLAAWILLMVFAFQGKKIQIPLVTSFAEKMIKQGS